MSAVRHYRADVPEPLRDQIDDFIFHESTHSMLVMTWHRPSNALRATSSGLRGQHDEHDAAIFSPPE